MRAVNGSIEPIGFLVSPEKSHRTREEAVMIRRIYMAADKSIEKVNLKFKSKEREISSLLLRLRCRLGRSLLWSSGIPYGALANDCGCW